MTGTKPLQILGVEKELHRRFKAACAVRDVSMTEVITAFMKGYANETDRMIRKGKD